MLLLSIMVVSCAAGAQDPDSGRKQAHPCDSGNEFHQFDFWVGEWDVHDAAGTLVGQNRISRREKGCVLLEEWQEHLGDDQALSSQDPGPLEIDLTGRERQPDRWQPDWIVAKYFEALNPPEPDSPEPDAPEPTTSSGESGN